MPAIGVRILLWLPGTCRRIGPVLEGDEPIDLNALSKGSLGKIDPRIIRRYACANDANANRFHIGKDDVLLLNGESGLFHPVHTDDHILGACDPTGQPKRHQNA